MESISTAVLLWGVIFGAFGMGYFLYGRKQKNFMAKISGIILMVFPYFISNTYLLVLIGVIFIALPFVVKAK
ncbi:MAG TPA: hypothetical protein PKG52_13030 [bacterium]|nr:hypothetical protein [bacterium]HPS31673.1 hypothetical protein [bacterium]